jgi:tRNA (adenine22-N1)-methyltransferase
MIADMVIKGKKVADIGADHALLPIYLLENQISHKVIIGELGDGPYLRAWKAVQACAFKLNIDVRQGNGLQILDYSEVNTIVLAGMGGDTIAEILEYDWDKTISFERFVLQPMTKAQVLRRRLADWGWLIEEERLGREHGRFFQVIASRPDNCPYTLTDLELEVGAALKADTELTREFIRACLHKYRRIHHELTYSLLLDGNPILDGEYQQKIERLEEILGESKGSERR